MGTLQAYASYLRKTDDLALSGLSTCAVNETAAATQCVCERRRIRARDDEVDATETASLCVVQGPCDGLVIDLRAGDRHAEELGVPRQRSYPAWHVACGTTGVRAS